MRFNIIQYSFTQFKSVFRKGFFHLLSANLITSVLSFGSQLLVTKILTPSQIGSIKTAQSFSSILAIISGFGFDTATLKLCSEKRDVNEKRAILFGNIITSIIISLVVMTIGFIAAKLCLFSPSAEVNRIMTVLIIILPPSVLYTQFIVYYQALKKIQIMATIQVLVKFFGITLVVLLTWKFGLKGFILASIFFSYISLLPFIIGKGNVLKGAKLPKFVLIDSFRYARWGFAANGVNTLGNIMDILMLNYLTTDRVSLGYYGIATIFLMALNQVAVTIQGITAPYFSEKHNNINDVMSTLRKYQKIYTGMSILLVVFSAVVIPIFISIVYGKNYSMAGRIFQILCIKYFVYSLVVLPGMALWGLGKINYNFYASLIVLCISLPVSFYLIKMWGFYGAAWAQVGSAGILLVCVFYFLDRVRRTHKSSYANS